MAVSGSENEHRNAVAAGFIGRYAFDELRLKHLVISCARCVNRLIVDDVVARPARLHRRYGRCKAKRKGQKCPHRQRAAAACHIAAGMESRMPKHWSQRSLTIDRS